MRELSVNFVRGLLESQCPDMRIDSLESYPNAGAMNLIFKMNKNILIRLPNGQISEDQLSREICSLRHIKPLGRLAFPELLFLGKSTFDYKYNWAIFRWIPGVSLSFSKVMDRSSLIEPLVAFLSHLRLHNNIKDSQLFPSKSNYFRGGSLSLRTKWVEDCISILPASIPKSDLLGVWREATASVSHKEDCLVHGDLHPGNILVDDSNLCGIIDFGCAAIGDPACDLLPAWSIFDSVERRRFVGALCIDRSEYLRGRGWALSFALGAISEFPGENLGKIGEFTLKQILDDLPPNSEPVD